VVPTPDVDERKKDMTTNPDLPWTVIAQQRDIALKKLDIAVEALQLIAKRRGVAGVAWDDVYGIADQALARIAALEPTPSDKSLPEMVEEVWRQPVCDRLPGPDRRKGERRLSNAGPGRDQFNRSGADRRKPQPDADEIAWLRRVIQWCRPRLKHDPYRMSLDIKLAAGPSVALDDEPQLIQSSQPDADGWIEWHGGECPVPSTVIIELRLRDRTVYSSNCPVSWCWKHRDAACDIIAYRIVGEGK
jgi:hypothetical protein